MEQFCRNKISLIDIFLLLRVQLMFLGYSTTVLQFQHYTVRLQMGEWLWNKLWEGGRRIQSWQNFPWSLKKTTSSKPNPGIIWTRSKISNSWLRYSAYFWEGVTSLTKVSTMLVVMQYLLINFKTGLLHFT